MTKELSKCPDCGKIFDAGIESLPSNAMLGEVLKLCDECDAVFNLLRKLYTKNGKGGKLLDNMIKKSNEIRKHFA